MVNLHTLNPQQRLAAETIRGPVLILAGAGTGKTREITSRVARLIEKGVNPGNILAVTFTNKAAREMHERASKLIGRPVKDPKTGEKPPRPAICTFHSLCMRILRSHIERLGYKRNFVIYSESDQLGAIKKILSHISDKAQKTDPAAVETLNRLYHFFGKALSVVTNLLDPDVIVVGGGVGNIPGLYTEGVRSLARHIFNNRLDVPVVPPSLGDSAGVFGAAALTLHA